MREGSPEEMGLNQEYLNRKKQIENLEAKKPDIEMEIDQYLGGVIGPGRWMDYARLFVVDNKVVLTFQGSRGNARPHHQFLAENSEEIEKLISQQIEPVYFQNDIKEKYPDAYKKASEMVVVLKDLAKKLREEEKKEAA